MGLPLAATAVTLFSVCVGSVLTVVWSVAPAASPAAGAGMGTFGAVGFVVVAGPPLGLTSSWESERGGTLH